jgi:hypothetical protein
LDIWFLDFHKLKHNGFEDRVGGGKLGMDSFS